MAKMLSPRKIKKRTMSVPVLVYTLIDKLPNKKTMQSEINAAADARLFKHVVALSDAHQKKSLSTPTSSTFASKDYVIPQLFDSAPNCGMRVITTDLSKVELENIGIEKLFTQLTNAVPAKTYFGTSVPYKIALQSYLKGSKPVADYLNVRTKNEIENTYKHGNLYHGLVKDITPKSQSSLFKAVAPLLVYLSRFRLGILGATQSHFLNLMEVDEILDEKLAEQLNVKKGQYVFFMHTGSGIIGRYIGYLYSPQKRNLRQKIEFAITKLGFISREYRSVKRAIKKAEQNNELVGFREGTSEHKLCVQALQGAGNQGFANRTVLTHNLDIALEAIFGRQITMNLVYDSPHILLSKEKHFGEQVWVHRNGSTRAYSEKLMNQEGLYKGGEPGFLAPFEDTYGYIGVGCTGNETTFYSANHELGKPKHIPDGVVDKVAKPNKYQPAEVPVFTKSRRWSTRSTKQDAGFAETVAKEIEDYGILRNAVRLKTVARLTHHNG